jgi:hypothetical protein
MGAENERRKAVRYRLSCPVLFTWHAGVGDERQGGGFSRDISTRGVYVACDRECPPVNTEISVEVLVPAPDSGFVAMKLAAELKVVRLGGFAEGTGFGAGADFAFDAFPLRSDVNQRISSRAGCGPPMRPKYGRRYEERAQQNQR